MNPLLAFGLIVLALVILGAWGVHHDRETWRRATEDFRKGLCEAEREAALHGPTQHQDRGKETR